ncbi:MAG: hypothetical protein ACRD4S_01260 [Candidatus Acidiferrales bacterium]
MASAAAVNPAPQLSFESALASVSPGPGGAPEDGSIPSAGSLPGEDSPKAEIRDAAIPREQVPRRQPPRELVHPSEASELDRRQYNREYMRQWRADPKNQVRDREKRRACYFARKERNARREESPYVDSYGKPLCGFCRKRRPTEEVVRLRVCDREPSGYAEVRIPYCGKC